MIAAAICAKGVRSPLAPTEPCDGTTGDSPCPSIASSSATVSGRTPDAPCARLASFSAIISRRSEEHTSKLQSLMRNSYAVVCLTKKKIRINLSRGNTKKENNRNVHTAVKVVKHRNSKRKHQTG